MLTGHIRVSAQVPLICMLELICWNYSSNPEMIFETMVATISKSDTFDGTNTVAYSISLLKIITTLRCWFGQRLTETPICFDVTIQRPRNVCWKYVKLTQKSVLELKTARKCWWKRKYDYNLQETKTLQTM